MSSRTHKVSTKRADETVKKDDKQNTLKVGANKKDNRSSSAYEREVKQMAIKMVKIIKLIPDFNTRLLKLLT